MELTVLTLSSEVNGILKLIILRCSGRGHGARLLPATCPAIAILLFLSKYKYYGILVLCKALPVPKPTLRPALSLEGLLLLEFPARGTFFRPFVVHKAVVVRLAKPGQGIPSSNPINLLIFLLQRPRPPPRPR